MEVEAKVVAVTGAVVLEAGAKVAGSMAEDVKAAAVMVATAEEVCTSCESKRAYHHTNNRRSMRSPRRTRTSACPGRGILAQPQRTSLSLG